MENIREVLSNIKERFTNPFLFAYFTTWLIVNWKITLAILWYEENSMKSGGYLSVFKFIESQLNTKKGFVIPLSFAIGYTILIPILRNLVRAFFSWCNKWGENWNLKILDGAKISLNKYISLRENHLITAKTLSNAFEKESKFLDENRRLIETLKNEQLKNEAYYKQLIEIQDKKKESQNSFIIDGLWQLSIVDDVSLCPLEEVSIKNGLDWHKVVNMKPTITAQIMDFEYNKDANELFFVLNPLKDAIQDNEESTLKVYKLKANFPDTMEGFENYDKRVVFNRIKLNA